MAKTASSMVPLGSFAPDFSLPDTVSGKVLSLKDLKSDKATVVMFICNHCPFVKHIQQELAALASDYKKKGISFIAISANDAVNYPDDAPDKMREVAETLGYSFPYLYDESQDVARAYGATCTPDLFVYDAKLKLVYRGQFDDSRPGNGVAVTGKDLKGALDAILGGKAVSSEQEPSIGCNIKWR